MKEHSDKEPSVFWEGRLSGSKFLQRARPLMPGELAKRKTNGSDDHSRHRIGGVRLSSSFSVFLLELWRRLEETPQVRVLLIDNTDSFTWNLAQQIRALGAVCDVVGNTDITVSDIRKMTPDRIVLSPGPGSPASAGVSLDILRELSGFVPILGVCLGHQCMAHVFGGKSFVGHAAQVMHGKTSSIRHTGKSIFQRIPSPFLAARYHSLVVKKLPKYFELLAWTGSGASKEIMAMKHATLPLFGVQFHPESFLTKHGEKLMKNFLSIS